MPDNIDTMPYRRSHIHHPCGYGLWIFESAETGESVELTGRYGEVVAKLDRNQTWYVLP